MKTYLFLIIYACFLLGACGHKAHQAKFYRKIGETNATDEGYHANEANRLLEYNEMNKEVNQKHAKEIQKKKNEDLTQLNKPNAYNSKTQRPKKKRFAFYM